MTFSIGKPVISKVSGQPKVNTTRLETTTELTGQKWIFKKQQPRVNPGTTTSVRQFKIYDPPVSSG